MTGWQVLVAEALGVPIRTSEPVAGGDINEAHLITLVDGRQLFVKTNPTASGALFAAEARGLRWLQAGDAIPVPQIVAVSPEEAAVGQGFLVLAWIVSGSRRRDFDERLGQGLAALHRRGAPSFGLDHDNFVGNLPQTNLPAGSWADFYRDRRLEPLIRRARDQGLLAAGLQTRLARLLATLPGRVGPPEPPARLHGDLWAGNLLVDSAGHPCLIDPAVYGGHREVDLAMMRLFGGFSARVFASYQESWPLCPGADERVPLYQLYPLLVHLNLFGGHYGTAVGEALDRLAL